MSKQRQRRRAPKNDLSTAAGTLRYLGRAERVNAMRDGRAERSHTFATGDEYRRTPKHRASQFQD